MHRLAPLALVLWLVSALIPSTPVVQAEASLAALASAGVQAQAAATSAKPASSKIWVGREAEFEQYLREAPIEKEDEVPIGVTKPMRAFFAPGGLAESVVIKNLPPGRHSGFWDSYKSEIAAYELDKLLDLEMVPVTVERRVNGELCSAQLWVENTVWLKTLKGKNSPDIYGWNRQVYRQRVWDNLIGNIDRNEGNLLVDPAWNLILIDHSRAFVTDAPPVKRMQFQMTKIDEPFYEKLKALDEATLKEHLDKWLVGGVKPILKRRDAIVGHFEQLIKEKGKDAIIII
jgi:hypothetical protein